MEENINKMAAPENYARPEPALASHHHIPHHHHIRRRQRQNGATGDEEVADEELDPRIQIELEKLNRASEEINRLELELDDARAAFRQVLSDSTQCLNALAKKLGTCVDKARPYYDSRLRLKETQLESQKAVLMFERSCSMHEAAKDMVQLAEEGYKRRERNLDPTWQEMLNHATIKVNEAERERTESEDYHQRVTLRFKQTQEEVQRLQVDLKKVIMKSKSYFEMKDRFNQVLEEQKSSVSRLEADVGSAKALYSQALCSLEAISDDIHRHRLEQGQKVRLGVREAGVGAESPSPSLDWSKSMVIEGSSSPDVVGSDADDDPIRASDGPQTTETILDVNQLKLSRHKSVILYEPAFSKKSSPKDLNPNDGSMKLGSQESFVFKTSLSDLQSMSCPQNFQSTHGYHAGVDAVRIRNYQSVVEPSNEKTLKWPENGHAVGAKEVAVDPALKTCLQSSAPSKSDLETDMVHQGIEHTPSELPPGRSSSSELSRHQNGEISKSRVSLPDSKIKSASSQEQQRFINASLPLPAIPLPSGCEPSSVTTSDIITIPDHSKILPSEEQEKSASIVTSSVCQQNISSTSVVAETLHTPRQNTPSASIMTESSVVEHPYVATRTTIVQPLLIPSTEQKVLTSEKGIPSLATEPIQCPNLSEPHTLLRKASKLQGLILQVGSDVANSRTPASVRKSAYHNSQHPNIIISTHHPMLGIFPETSVQPRPPVSL